MKHEPIEQKYHDDQIARVKPLCLATIETLRGFLDDAERAVNDERTSPEDAIGRVLHGIAWGFANASSGLFSALSSLEDARKIIETEQGQ